MVLPPPGVGLPGGGARAPWPPAPRPPSPFRGGGGGGGRPPPRRGGGSFAGRGGAPRAGGAGAGPPGPTPRVVDLLNQEGLIETRPVPPGDPVPTDLTREPLRFPANRATRLQNLARGDEGFLLAMAYSTQRGYSHSHPFVGEVRLGTVAVEIEPEELGFAIDIGDIEITECEMVNQFAGSKSQPPQFTRGYGLVFGRGERKAPD